jgi:hypothetical protein
MVLIAGLILSSLPPDKIKSNPHHNINTIENTQEAKTNNDIDNKINSPKSILGQKIEAP